MKNWPSRFFFVNRKNCWCPKVLLCIKYTIGLELSLPIFFEKYISFKNPIHWMTVFRLFEEHCSNANCSNEIQGIFLECNCMAWQIGRVQIGRMYSPSYSSKKCMHADCSKVKASAFFLVSLFKVMDMT